MNDNNRPPRRVLVTGSRTWVSPRVIRDALQKVWGDGDAVLVSGACPTGADRIAEMFWRRWGGRIERHPADWDQHGTRAGFVRNQAMVDAGADVCVAFIHDNSPGATNMVRLAQAAGIPVDLHSHTTRDTGGQLTETEPAAPDADDGGHDREDARSSPGEQASGPEPAMAASAGEWADQDEDTTAAVVATDGLGGEVVAARVLLSPAEVAAYYSYPEISVMLAKAPDAQAAQVCQEALSLLLTQPGLYAGGDQTDAIARQLSAAQIAQHRKVIGHGPLFDALGRAADQQTRQHAEPPPSDTRDGEAAGSVKRANRAVEDLLRALEHAQRAATHDAQQRQAALWNDTATDDIASTGEVGAGLGHGHDNGGVR